MLTKPLGGQQHALALKAVRLEKLKNRDKNVGDGGSEKGLDREEKG